jgi:hypothetical protein
MVFPNGQISVIEADFLASLDELVVWRATEPPERVMSVMLPLSGRHSNDADYRRCIEFSHALDQHLLLAVIAALSPGSADQELKRNGERMVGLLAPFVGHAQAGRLRSELDRCAASAAASLQRCGSPEP